MQKDIKTSLNALGGENQSAKTGVTTSCKSNEMIVLYKNRTSHKNCECLKKEIHNKFADAKIKKHSNCGKLELWEINDIQSTSHGEGMVSAMGSSKTHADFSLNFTNTFPCDNTLPRGFQWDKENLSSTKKDDTDKNIIIIAVLDTGVNFDLIPEQYLWQNDKVGSKDTCYENDKHGWNFVDNSPDIHDDDPNMHGTLINAYIIEQFKNSPHNSVQIMNLKTHDAKGSGDLFSAICAIRYAKEKGAHIINASWGFYGDKGFNHPYLKRLITQTLKRKGIFFVTAAGNKIDEFDSLFIADFSPLNPRNLNDHQFFPANFGKGITDVKNNIITVTTIDEVKGVPSPTQNFSSKIVDLGVQADNIDIASGFFQFEVPFKSIKQEMVYIGGSSFATAIASGKIGAFLPKDYSSDRSSRNKKRLIDALEGLDFPLFHKGNKSLRKYIKKGRFIKKD